MDLQQAKKQQQDLQKEAREVLKKLNLEKTFSKIGKVEYVGSLSYQLLVLRDIDINVFVIDPLKELDKINDAANSLIKNDAVRKISVLKHGYNYPPDEGKPLGIYVGIEVVHENNLWKIDSWFLTKKAAENEALGLKVLEATEQQHDLMLLLKAQLHEVNRYGPKKEYYSADIYRAVHFGDVSTIEELDAWHASKDS